jgi:6-phosphogluconolactonase
VTPAGVEIVVSEDAEGAARVVAERLAEQARSGGQIALTGGSTPRRAYELAAELEPDWCRVALWWGDERCVAPGDERSNYAMARGALLDRLRMPPEAVHRIQGELGPDRGAEEYTLELKALDAFDLVLLGLGADGHVASLFPHQPTLDVAERCAIGAEAHLEPFVDRITLTLPMLRSAREVLFLVVGEGKAPAAAAAFAGPPTRNVPGSLVRAGLGPTRAVLDPAAAAGLA